MVVNNSKESANKEKKSTEQTSKQHHVNEKEKPSQIVSNTDVLNKMPAYIEEGESCYEIEDIIDRGDCFQHIHSSHSLWIIDQSKDTFYYPFHHD